MLKQIVKETVKILIDRPRIIRLALLTSYSYTFYQIYGIIYFINGLVNIKYNSGVDISNALIYFVNAIQRFNILRLIITIAIIFLLGISIFGPVGRQALLYSVDNPNMRTGTAFIKGWKKWGIMAEFGGVNMWGLSMRSVFIFAVRFWMLGYLNNPVIIAVFTIWIICVLGKIILWPYVIYYIILRDYSAWDAVIKSMTLSLSNFGLTIRGLLRQATIRCRFLVNSCIVIGIPLIIMIFCIQMNLIDNSAIEIITRILVSVGILIFMYLEAIFKAFDYTYWYKIFLEAEKRDNINFQQKISNEE